MRSAGVVRVWIAVLSLLFLVSCSASGSSLVGRWETEIQDEALGSMSLVYHFTDDGKVFLEQGEGDEISFSILFGSYELCEDGLVISSDGKESVYTFSVSERELVLCQEGEEELIFQKIPE